VTIWASLKSSLGVRGLGCLPDPLDSRDAGFHEMPLGVSTPPPSADLSGHVATVLDQTSTNACVGYSWAQALRIQMILDGWGARTFLPSPHAIYFWARAYTGMQNQDSGTFLRDAARALKQFGFPSETAWPSKPRTVQNAPGIAAFRSAADQRKLAGYYRIARGDTGAMRLAIAAGKPVVFGLQLAKSFLEGSEKTIDYDTGRATGGHAMIVTSYESDRFKVLSSWGSSWRENGFCWISERRMHEAQDAWICDLRSL
jgi:hypothetical protein